jgi:hypothetical protein
MSKYFKLISITLNREKISELYSADCRRIGKSKNGLHVIVFLCLAVDQFDPLANMYKKKK